MSKKSQHEEEVIVDIEEVYSKSEQFIEKYKKPLSFIIGAVIVIVASYFAYIKFHLEPMELDAQVDMFKAEQYFSNDSLDKAMYGDGANFGFIDIIDNYGGTKSANLAHYYLGVCYLNKGEYADAIDQLERFSSDDIMLSAVAIGAIGDAHMQLGDADEAISHYVKAAHHKKNDFTTPIYLMKAGQAAEAQGDFNAAVKYYTEIKEDYPKTNEGANVDKFLARASSFTN